MTTKSSDYAYLLYDQALWHWHRNEFQKAFEAAQRSLSAAQDFGRSDGECPRL